MPGLPEMRAGLEVVAGSAFFDDEFEMNAAWTPRNGRRPVAGLAVMGLVVVARVNVGDRVPRSAMAVADRVVENIVMVVMREWGWRRSGGCRCRRTQEVAVLVQ